jgi:tRNA pseudouridine38-40 synthase
MMIQGGLYRPFFSPALLHGNQRMRFKLTLEFDGTRYSGWQKQADARTLQGALLDAAAGIFPDQSVDLQGCGRTDAGVHALRYPAHLEAVTELAPALILERLNGLLPTDINILTVDAVQPRFHARHHCLGRSYLYQISRRRTALCRRYVHWRQETLVAERMAEAVQVLAGMHDFSAFTDRRALKGKSPLVLINKAEIKATEELILFRLVGSHFLWKMVRNIVGVLMEIGAGRLPASEMAELLAGRGEPPLGLAAPAAGLFFEAAFYEEAEFTRFLDTEPLPACYC